MECISLSLSLSLAVLCIDHTENTVVDTIHEFSYSAELFHVDSLVGFTNLEVQTCTERILGYFHAKGSETCDVIVNFAKK